MKKLMKLGSVRTETRVGLSGNVRDGNFYTTDLGSCIVGQNVDPNGGQIRTLITTCPN